MDIAINVLKVISLYQDSSYQIIQNHAKLVVLPIVLIVPKQDQFAILVLMDINLNNPQVNVFSIQKLTVLRKTVSNAMFQYQNAQNVHLLIT